MTTPTHSLSAFFRLYALFFHHFIFLCDVFVFLFFIFFCFCRILFFSFNFYFCLFYVVSLNQNIIALFCHFVCKFLLNSFFKTLIVQHSIITGLWFFSKIILQFSIPYVSLSIFKKTTNEYKYPCTDLYIHYVDA